MCSDHYLERCCACILSADGVSIVGPHDLINPVAFGRERLLGRHDTQLLQLREGKRHFSMGSLLHCLFQFMLHHWERSAGIQFHELLNLHLYLLIKCNPKCNLR